MLPIAVVAEAEAAFGQFAPPVGAPSDLRRKITNAYRLSEADAVLPLIDAARVDAEQAERISKLAQHLVTRLRGKGQQGGVQGLVKEYSLSTQEGVALMCLAEALLRIPDNATRDALIRDKITSGNWSAHLGEDRSIFVNAATWGLVVTGKLVTPVQEHNLTATLTGLIKRAGEPVIRSGVNMAMEMMGEQFVTGETIAEALKRAREQEKRGFSYSYDMLGEAAMTMDDAEAYRADYERAIHAIGKAAAGRGIYAGPGISIKLSALHPRYERSQLGRVMAELLPRLKDLALLARNYDIGLNIDAEEADRLELSLDLLEALALDPDLAGWDGLGFVVQAYGKRCPMVLDWLIELAQRSGHRIMVRLVKGAYWDSEIKRAQTDGLADFPVFTRKVHTDCSYIAGARKLLDARGHVFPQFATHNAQTVATIHELAGPEFALGDYEFQCLHGMGEPLYDEVVGASRLNRPCRIYAPVGTHETLLAYLVRRLLENGANSSFVNRIWDENVPMPDLARDPVGDAETIDPVGSPHPLIKLPRDLYPERDNARGLDLSDESVLARLTTCLQDSANQDWRAQPGHTGTNDTHRAVRITNPADNRDVVGHAVWASEQEAAQAVQRAENALGGWAATPIEERAACLDRAADALEAQMEALLGLIMREAGKSAVNAVAEVREAVDFLRYYAQQGRGTLASAEPLGPVVCISPWNFPLAIFTGQIAAALVAGNTVLAKPAEETPLIAAQAVAILHQAGVPPDALQLVPGAGDIGAALVAAEPVCGVMFTGSTEVAKLIQRQLAGRLLSNGAPTPLIAETGGQNAMVVDSSALPEQVVRDVIGSAFDSAGQRCSALRVLCVQEDVAEEIVAMLKGAMEQLRIGNTQALSSDVGPVISAQAKNEIAAHVERMRASGHAVHQLGLGEGCSAGTFIAPTLIEISEIGELGREVFGPVLHILRYARRDLDKVLRHINATGYGLTFGIHSRIDETIADVTGQVAVGNIYVNRNVIGAIVGVQPFGGRGLSGTGPKAGGPLYLGRLVRNGADMAEVLAPVTEMPGPVGERNLYALHPRGRVLLLAQTEQGLQDQLDATLATGNSACLPDHLHPLAQNLPAEQFARLEWIANWQAEPPFAHVLIEAADGNAAEDVITLLQAIAAKDGPIPIVQVGGAERPYRRDWMLEEVSTSIDTTAAGGNASLMAVV